MENTYLFSLTAKNPTAAFRHADAIDRAFFTPSILTLYTFQSARSCVRVDTRREQEYIYSNEICIRPSRLQETAPLPRLFEMYKNGRCWNKSSSRARSLAPLVNTIDVANIFANFSIQKEKPRNGTRGKMSDDVVGKVHQSIVPLARREQLCNISF